MSGLTPRVRSGPVASRTRSRLRLLPPGEGYMPYLWLVYMAWTFVYPAALGSLPMFIETTVAAAAFLVLYFRGYWVDGRALWPILVGIAAIGAILGPINPIGVTYFVFAASFAPYVGSTGLAWRIIVALIAALLLETLLLHLGPYFWIPGVVFTALVGAATVRSREMYRMNAELRAARDDVERLAKVA
ncbi:MAG: hypothetical protein M3R44_05955, partial [Candidatus Eremiobacteraeota bacterium]|nr:hypothetical protein [Candidatus Eremiobacteraeota bacterium]